MNEHLEAAINFAESAALAAAAIAQAEAAAATAQAMEKIAQVLVVISASMGER